MAVGIGLLFAFAGCVAALAGLTARGRVRRLRRSGRSAWAMIVPAPSPSAGQKVLVWYDAADPTDVLVNGWDGRYGNLAFLAVGVVFLAFGMCIALGH